ncbi:hypothetical protein L218DRAFT_962842 [Marasmius fiardii PR-910]|nr:hypothetical protein L218DRAFT_962842 [Marasmius fiardii PR-910]
MFSPIFLLTYSPKDLGGNTFLAGTSKAVSYFCGVAAVRHTSSPQNGSNNPSSRSVRDCHQGHFNPMNHSITDLLQTARVQGPTYSMSIVAIQRVGHTPSLTSPPVPPLRYGPELLNPQSVLLSLSNCTPRQKPATSFVLQPSELRTIAV